MLYMVAILAAFEASLTLPGIAGLVLTIGMAVDANIIIYERIREELRAGQVAAHAPSTPDSGARSGRCSTRTSPTSSPASSSTRTAPAHPRLRRHAAGRHHHQPVHFVLGVALDVRRPGRPPGRGARHAVDLEARPWRRRIRQQKFFEVIKPGSNFEFIGKQQLLDRRCRSFLVVLTFVMLPLNAYVFKSRGHMLNWGVDFRGGTEMVVEFSKPVDAGEDPQGPRRRRLQRRRRRRSTRIRPASPSTTSCCASARSRCSTRSRPRKREVAAGQGRRRHPQEVRVVRGRRQVLPALRQAGRARASLQNSLKAIGIKHDPGAAVRPRRGEHLRGDAGRPRRRDPQRARRALRRRRGAGDPAGRVGRRQGRQAAAVRRRHGRCCSRSCSSWSTSPSGSTSGTARAPSSRCSTTRSSSSARSRSRTRSSR